LVLALLVGLGWAGRRLPWQLGKSQPNENPPIEIWSQKYLALPPDPNSRHTSIPFLEQ
jgi:hypothetical protein